MNKNLLFAAFAMMVAGLLVSCQKEQNSLSPSEQDVRMGVVGKWKIVTYSSDKPVPTNSKGLCTYHIDGTADCYYASKDSWMNYSKKNYDVVGNVIVEESLESYSVSRKTISRITSDRMTVSSYECFPSGLSFGEHEYELVSSDFSKSIIGFWQGVDMEGQSTYGNADHVWEYKADGSYVYYNKDENGVWVPQEQESYYVIDGDFLASKWTINDTTYTEWWDVKSCDNQKMEWTSLRENEDGTTFENNFTMKRVQLENGSILSEAYIKSVLPGRWTTVSVDGRLSPTNFRGSYLFNVDGSGYYSTAINDNWKEESKFDYSIKLNNYYIDFLNSTESDCKSSILSLTADTLKVISTEIETPQNSVKVYKHVTADYSQAIVGLWEGVSMTGENTFGDQQHRWRYNEDGTYVYYEKDGENWVASKQVLSEYQVAGDWLATRFRKTDQDAIIYERWDIVSCDRTQMLWSAIREKEDGTRYIATFTMKRIN